MSEPRIVVQQKGPGCLRLLGLSLTLPVVGCIGLAICAVVLCGGVLVLIGAGEKAATEQAVQRNGGLGTLDEPIPARTWARFKDGNVLAVRTVRPANAMIEGFSAFNRPAAAGADYVLVWFQFQCQKDKCIPWVDTDLYLVAPDGKSWDEIAFLDLDDHLDTKEALKGAVIEGWQAFEFPSGSAVRAVRVKWGAETLYLQLPSG